MASPGPQARISGPPAVPVAGPTIPAARPPSPAVPPIPARPSRPAAPPIPRPSQPTPGSIPSWPAAPSPASQSRAPASRVWGRRPVTGRLRMPSRRPWSAMPSRPPARRSRAPASRVWGRRPVTGRPRMPSRRPWSATYSRPPARRSPASVSRVPRRRPRMRPRPAWPATPRRSQARRMRSRGSSRAGPIPRPAIPGQRLNGLPRRRAPPPRRTPARLMGQVGARMMPAHRWTLRPPGWANPTPMSLARPTAARLTAARPKLAGGARQPVRPRRVAATGARVLRRTNLWLPRMSRPLRRVNPASSRTTPLTPRLTRLAGPPGPAASSQPAARLRRQNQPASAGVPRRPQTTSRSAQMPSPRRPPPQQLALARLPRPSQRPGPGQR